MTTFKNLAHKYARTAEIKPEKKDTRTVREAKSPEMESKKKARLGIEEYNEAKALRLEFSL